MNAPIETGGPAFPIPDQANRNGDVQPGAPGMTLRDWFAGQALAGIMSNNALHKDAATYAPDNSLEENAASLAYEVADAALAVRKKGH